MAEPSQNPFAEPESDLAPDAPASRWRTRSRQVLLPVLIVGGAVALVAAMVALRSDPEPKAPEIPVPAVHVERVHLEPVRFSVRAHGTVAPRTESDLIPQVSGPVVWVSPTLASGGFFEAGEPLVRIERADYEVALESRRAAVARAEAEAYRAQKQLDRQKQLADRAVGSDSDYDDAVQREKVSAAALREARAQLEQAERDLERTELRAPYAGRVREENVGVGEFVTRGATIAKLYAVDFAEVRLPIPDAELGYLDLPMVFHEDGADAQGPEVRLVARFAGGRHEWLGHIVRSEGEIDAKSRMVHVVARVDDPYGRRAMAEQERVAEDTASDGIALEEAAPLSPVQRSEPDLPAPPVEPAPLRPPLAVGLFVEAEIEGREVERAAKLPRSALREDDRVVVVAGDRSLHFRDVQVLRIDRDTVVVGAGLEDGEEVLTSPLQAVVEGMKVRVTPKSPVRARGDGDDS